MVHRAASQCLNGINLDAISVRQWSARVATFRPDARGVAAPDWFAPPPASPTPLRVRTLILLRAFLTSLFDIIKIFFCLNFEFGTRKCFVASVMLGHLSHRIKYSIILCAGCYLCVAGLFRLKKILLFKKFNCHNY